MVNYITKDQLKAGLPDSQLDASYDTYLDVLITRVSELIDELTGRRHGAYNITADSVRYYDGTGCEFILIDELITTPTSVAVAESGNVDDASGSGGDYTLWSTSDYRLYPDNAASDGIPYEGLVIDRLYGTKTTWYDYPKCVKITGRFGYSASVPKTIEQLAIVQGSRWFKRGQEAYMDSMSNRTIAEMRYLEDLDPDVKVLLKRYTRTVI